MSVAILRYEAPSPAAPAAQAIVLQRGRGAAEVAFARRRGTTVLAQLYQRTPCRVLFPRPEADDLPHAVLLTTSGGLTGGDAIKLSVTVGAAAKAVATAQAAEKIYRSLGPNAEVAITLAVEDEAWLEWLPQETILFDGARLDRRLDIAVAPRGRLLAAEMLTFGRAARGERLRRGMLKDRWRVSVGDRLAWADALRLDGDIAASLDRPFAFAGAEALATALYVGPDAAELLSDARALIARTVSRAGVSLVAGMLVARFLDARAALVRGDLGRYVAGLRHRAAGLPEHAPRLWQI
jgi:urease accessory protein